jgi:hypothetical protein
LFVADAARLFSAVNDTLDRVVLDELDPEVATSVMANR